MKQSRFEQLADGIFAIVMTLLVLEIRVPELNGFKTDASLAQALALLFPSVMSYFLSFALLFTYWRGHHFITSVLARNVDHTLANINAAFFLFVALVPFSSYLLGKYSNLYIAIFLYGINMIVIGLLLFLMRSYVFSARTIDNAEVNSQERRNGAIRILFPVVSAAGALIVGVFNPKLALALFTLAILFNLFAISTKVIGWILPAPHSKER